MENTKHYRAHMPPRIKKPSLRGVMAWMVFIGLLGYGLFQTDVTMERLTSGLVNMVTFITNAFPPNAARLGFMGKSMFETFQMALIGTTLGVTFSLPISILASRNTSPNIGVRSLTRSFVSTVRTIPDLIWALIFVISVGLGPLAGILTIMVDTIGFCGRFFSERIEELDKGPMQALESTGASSLGTLTGSVLPMAFPSFVGTSLYAVEKAIRSAVILGLVGAGGIGVELSTAMTLRRFDEALMIIILILVVVLSTEQVSSQIRKRVI